MPAPRCFWRHAPWLVVTAAALVGVHRVLGAETPIQWDSVNHAFGVERFDPLGHRPHPPGYLFTVLGARALLPWAADAHGAMVVLAALCAGLAVLPSWALFRRYTSGEGAWWLTLLMATQPVAWYFGSVGLSGITGLLVAPLAVSMLLRGMDGGAGGLLGGSLLVGLAGGVRQDLEVFLVLPWVVAVARGRHSGGCRVAAGLLLVAGTLAWLVPTAVACGGVGAWLEATDYMRDIVARESLVFGGSAERTLATVHRVVQGALLALGPVAFLGLLRFRARRGCPRGDEAFLAAWAVPPLVFFLVFYFHKKAYLFPVLPALMVLGWLPWLRGGITRRTRVLLALSLVWGNGLFFGLPATEGLYRRDDGFLERHADLPLVERVQWHWRETTRAEIAAVDERNHRVAEALRGVLAGSPGDAVLAVLPDEPTNLRKLMWLFPERTVFGVHGEGRPWRRVDRGRGGRWERAVGEEMRRLGNGRVVVWLVSRNAGMAEELVEGGGRLVEAGPGIRFVVARE